MANDFDRVCCLHVKTWTWIIALVEFIIACVGFGDAIGNITAKEKRAQGVFWTQLMIQGIWVVFIIMLIVALYKNRARLIIPHLVVSFIVVLFFVVNTILIIINHVTFWAIIYNGLLIFIVVTFLWIEYRCYLWMKDYHEVVIDI